ncbi:hypothetical protein R1flu_017869 [Riccia fluitans]|uniref:N-acylneuraminate-9-phosphatase n=1 Tax=Riccia fluitans TaxID=41844 RepID=A0ABD1ZE80_9MARC
MASKSSALLVRGLCRSLKRLGTSSSNKIGGDPQPSFIVSGLTEMLGPARAATTLPVKSPLSLTRTAGQQSRRVSGSAQQAVGVQTDAALLDDDDYSFDYDYQRRAANGGLSHKALLVDAAGTLLIPSQPAAKVYREIGLKYGVTYSEEEILARYRWAYSQPWSQSRLRYVNDGRPFWQYIVEQATGCSDRRYFEELYLYYTTAEAWHVGDKEAGKVFAALRKAGVKLAVVSNFDTRLRPLMKDLNCDHWFDTLAVSAEVEAEKPNPTIFLHACEALGVKPEETVHVGDDRRNDIWGARDAGCDAWLWGSDVYSFRQVAERIGVEVEEEEPES